MNEKMKEEGKNKPNPGHGRKYEHRSEDNKKEHVDENQGKTVITTRSQVTQLLKEMINEIGMDFGRANIESTAKPITHAFIHFMDIRSANMLKKELRGRKVKITRSMDAEERFHHKRMGYVKYCIHTRHNILLAKHVSVKGQIVVKTCQSVSLKFSKYQDIDCEQS